MTVATTSSDLLDANLEDEGREGSRRFLGWVLLGLLVLMSVSLNVAHVARYDMVGPIDELQHFDAALRASEGELIGSGDMFSQEALRIESCRGVDAPGVSLPACPSSDGTYLDPKLYQEGGYNTAFIHPPTYYLIDGSFGRVVSVILPDRYDDLTAVRLAGLVWAVLSVVALWVLLAEVGADIWSRFALALLVVGSLTVLEATSVVNVDATALPLGALLMWAVLRWERGRIGAWAPVAVAIACAATKVTNLLAVGVVLVYLMVRLLNERQRVLQSAALGGDCEVVPRPAVRRYLVLAGEILAAAIVPMVLWTVAQKFLQEVPPDVIPMTQRLRYATFPWVEVASSWKSGVSPLSTPYLIPEVRTPRVSFFVAAIDATLMVIAVAGTILAGRRSRIEAVGAAALGMAVALGPAVVLFNAIVQGAYVVVPARYGLSIVPMLLAAGVPVLARYRSAAVVVGLVGGIAYLTVLVALV